MDKIHSQWWLVTYKVLRNTPMPQQHDYEVAMLTLNAKGIIHDYNYEHDSRGKLHLHAVYEMKKNTFIKNFIIYGMHMNFTPIDASEVDRVKSYIHKEDKKGSVYLFDDDYYVPEYASK